MAFYHRFMDNRFPESLSIEHLASQGRCSLPLQALDNEQVNRSNSHFQNLEKRSDKIELWKKRTGNEKTIFCDKRRKNDIL